MRSVSDLRVNVVLARRYVAGIEDKLPLHNIGAGARLDGVENRALVAIIRIGIIIERDVDGSIFGRELIELEKVIKGDIVALNNGLGGQEVEFDDVWPGATV
jgi:hypothetical protein